MHYQGARNHLVASDAPTIQIPSFKRDGKLINDIKQITVLSPVLAKTIVGGCLMPMAEPFLSNKNVIARYLPKGTTIQSFEFDTCSGANCFDFTPEGMKLYNMTF